MAKLKGKGVVVSALLAGAASYLSKKQNREKLMNMFQGLQSKTSSKTEHSSTKYNNLTEIAEAAAGPTSTKIRENNFIAEGGGQTALAYYNEDNQQTIH
ncbi:MULTISPECIES: hypothetical protein [Lysinibacillus]|uniref:hypothetical protein n=1 Tax=Lysinibacillus TaxID=400634 RepID=UPI001FE72EBA|nr:MULTISPECIES: hypothetical protein [Lysinibacillus]